MNFTLMIMGEAASVKSIKEWCISSSLTKKECISSNFLFLLALFYYAAFKSNLVGWKHQRTI